LRFLTRTEKFVFDVLRGDFTGYAEGFFVYKGFLVRKNRGEFKEVTVDRVIVQFVERLISVMKLEKLFSSLSFSMPRELCYTVFTLSPPPIVFEKTAGNIILNKAFAFTPSPIVFEKLAGVIECTKEYSIYQA